MDKETVDHIKNVLRQGTITWHVRAKVLNRHRERRPIGFYKDKKRSTELKYKWFYPCHQCWEYFETPDTLEVDHIVEIGSFEGNWHTFIMKMYCVEENLQALCTVCHARKTAKFNSSHRFERKRIPERIEADLL